MSHPLVQELVIYFVLRKIDRKDDALSKIISQGTEFNRANTSKRSRKVTFWLKVNFYGFLKLKSREKIMGRRNQNVAKIYRKRN